MQFLSTHDIENIAGDILRRFSPCPANMLRSTNILDFAQNVMGLSLDYGRLSPDGSVLGLTSFTDTACELWEDEYPILCRIPKNIILLDESLRSVGLTGRAAFTMAHECAHHILHRCEYAGRAYERVMKVAMRSDVKDWSEWQADVMAAALLLPRDQMQNALSEFTGKSQISANSGYVRYSEKKGIQSMAHFYGASYTATVIRLKQLGLTHGWNGKDALGRLEIEINEEAMQ